MWNRRARKSKKNRINPVESWIWSDEQAHEPLVSKEVFEKAAGKGKSRANASRIEDSSPRADSAGSRNEELLILRSFVRCGICDLRMQGHRNRGSHYYSCEPHRRAAGLIPDGHPPLSEAKAVEKIVYFLNSHIFGPDRIPCLAELLDSSDPKSTESERELTLLKADLTAIDGKIRRHLGHLEAEDAATSAAMTLRDRLRELTDLRTKKEREIQSHERAFAALPSIQSASSLLEWFPIEVVDVDCMGKEAFRDLLRILSFQGSFEPNDRSLNVRVVLLPELVGEGGPFTRVFSVPPTGFGTDW